MSKNQYYQHLNEIVKEKHTTLPSVITYSEKSIFDYFCNYFLLDDMLKEMNKVRSKSEDVLYKKDVLFRLKMKHDLQSVEDQKTNNKKRKI